LAGLSVADQAPRWRKIALGAGALALSAGIAACYLGPRWLVMIANDSAARGFTPLQRVMTEWRVNPKHVSALVNLGLVHNRLHDYGEAAAVLEQALALDGANVLAQDALIVAYYNAGRHKQASALARQALAARPLDARLHAFLGASLLASGERVAGLIELREALRFDPQQPVARSMLARLGPAASR
jgi:tetratricopeptide (TPR) repeat protein